MKRIDLRNLARVVINEHGEAIPPPRAKKMGITPDIVFVRTDGWMLGAPMEFVDVAEQMWLDMWEVKIILPF